MREERRIKIRRQRRRWRSRKKIFGQGDKPRLVVFRSGKHIYSQIIDDEQHKTLAAASTLSPAIREAAKAGSWNKTGAEKVGELIATLAKEKGISAVCFDRNGYKFHGRIKALADGARKNGLKF